MLITLAPPSTAIRMPTATAAALFVPVPLRILMGRIFAPGAMPSTPSPAALLAAMMPAMCVPCPSSSARPSPEAP